MTAPYYEYDCSTMTVPDYDCSLWWLLPKMTISYGDCSLQQFTPKTKTTTYMTAPYHVSMIQTYPFSQTYPFLHNTIFYYDIAYSKFPLANTILVWHSSYMYGGIAQSFSP